MEKETLKTKRVYPVICPVCHEKREVSYQSWFAISNKISTGNCKTCGRLIMARVKLEATKSKTVTARCISCEKDILVSKWHHTRYGASKDVDGYVCIYCLIDQRKKLRGKHEKEKIKPYDGKQAQTKGPEKFSFFGCTLTEKKLHKEEGVSVSSRCKLGETCKYFLICLNKAIEKNWKGFTAVGPGHLKSTSLY